VGGHVGEPRPSARAGALVRCFSFPLAAAGGVVSTSGELEKKKAIGESPRASGCMGGGGGGGVGYCLLVAWRGRGRAGPRAGSSGVRTSRIRRGGERPALLDVQNAIP
jgi:hypothetical protein